MYRVIWFKQLYSVLSNSFRFFNTSFHFEWVSVRRWLFFCLCHPVNKSESFLMLIANLFYLGCQGLANGRPSSRQVAPKTQKTHACARQWRKLNDKNKQITTDVRRNDQSISLSIFEVPFLRLFCRNTKSHFLSKVIFACDSSSKRTVFWIISALLFSSDAFWWWPFPPNFFARGCYRSSDVHRIISCS